jgi:hypothetical protein
MDNSLFSQILHAIQNVLGIDEELLWKSKNQTKNYI